MFQFSTAAPTQSDALQQKYRNLKSVEICTQIE